MGRACGERINTHKLTAKQVHAILRCYADKRMSQKKLGEKYGVSQANIHYIISGKTWRDVT